MLDAVYFSAIQEEIYKELGVARLATRYARTNFESLKSEKLLPVKYREAYEKMAESLRNAEKSINLSQAEINELEKSTNTIFLDINEPVSPEVAISIRRIIEEINTIEVQFVRHCELIIANFRKNDDSGLIDWGVGFDYYFTVLLDPGAERDFYEASGDAGDPIKISLGPYSARHLLNYDKLYNWNILEGHEANPLKDDHHGYLVHCIIDHSVIPWQLIGHIKEINVQLELQAFEKFWSRSAVT